MCCLLLFVVGIVITWLPELTVSIDLRIFSKKERGLECGRAVDRKQRGDYSAQHPMAGRAPEAPSRGFCGDKDRSWGHL